MRRGTHHHAFDDGLASNAGTIGHGKKKNGRHQR
jgi:hypothetical protein